MKFIRHIISSKRDGEAAQSSAAELHEKDRRIKQLMESQDALLARLERRQPSAVSHHHQDLESNLAIVVTNAWKARAKMFDPTTNEPREEMRRVYRHLESMFDAFQQMGLQVKDHVGETFDYGSSLIVIATQPTPGLAKERIIETIKPTIYWHEIIIQPGEVIIATPA